ncbi:MAG: aldehyde ferredoxin oxidoreductase family protein [Anaerolineae bacterium]
MSFGYSGKILWVDLTRAEFREERTERYGEWIGGRSLGSFLLSRYQQPGADSPETEFIVIAAGPLVATGLPLGTRTAVIARNRLSGGISYSNVGGDFGTRLKMAGYDAIVVQGASKTPVYLLLQDSGAKLIHASHLSGLKISQLREALHEAHGSSSLSLLGIGPAGEREVAISCLIADRAHAAGWGGSGAILGAKRLKAIVAVGDQPVSVFDEAGVRAKIQQLNWRINTSEAAAGLIRGGTHGMAGAGGFSGLVPTAVRNLQDEYLSPEESAPIREGTFKQWEIDRVGCVGCGVQCLHLYEMESSRYGRLLSEGMHANSVRGLASNWGVNEPEDLLMAHTLCNEYGLDVDGVSAAVAFALECAEQDIISAEQAGGIRLEWGDGRSAVELVRQIGEGIGLGKLLGRGVFEAAQEIGNGSQKFAMTVKRVGVNEQGLRSHRAWSLGVMTSTRGGGHLGGSPQTENRRVSPELGQRLFKNPSVGDPGTYEGKGRLVAWTEGLKCVVDSLGLCYFVYGWYDLSMGNPDELAELLYLVTGMKISGDELHRRGLRCHTMERYFSYIHGGYSRKDDFLPERFFQSEVSSGPYRGAHLDPDDVERMLDEYYAYLGWDTQTGLPTEEALKGLGLGFLLSLRGEASNELPA